MYEDRTIEEKYLYNFSQKEKASFYKEQKKKLIQFSKYVEKLYGIISSESPAIFANYVPSGASSPLEIKYVLNRIAANDPIDIAFELGKIDGITFGDQLAPTIAQAFQKNTRCETVILDHIGLTDVGLLPILESLRDKRLTFLDIEGNKATDKSWQKVNEILSDPHNKWKNVQLGKIKTTPQLAQSLAKHPNLSFAYVASSPKKSSRFLSCFLRQKS